MNPASPAAAPVLNDLHLARSSFMKRMLSAFVGMFLLSALAVDLAAQTPGAKNDKVPDKVSYYKDVRPIFQLHCQGCHQPAKAQGGYVMTSFADLLKKSDHDHDGIVAGQPEKSAVYQQIIPKDGKPPAMPRDADPLSSRSVAVIKRWIEQGATDDT